MSGFPIIDLVAGMIFIYFLLAIINNSLFEIFASLFKLRAYYLRMWLIEVFSGKLKTADGKEVMPLSQAIMDHPLVDGLSGKCKSNTYMSSKEFAAVLVDLITNEQQKTSDTIDDIEAAFASTPLLPAEMKRSLKSFAVQAKSAIEVVNKKISEVEYFTGQLEGWFDRSMERLTGKFKRRSLMFAAIFGSIITFALNIDSIALINYLYNNPEARQQLATSAYAASEDTTYKKLVSSINEKKATLLTDTASGTSADSTASSLAFTVDSLIAEYEKQKLVIDTVYATISSAVPIGWNDNEWLIFSQKHNHNKEGWVCFLFIITKLGGFAITILALCLGAPFWFDVLGKIANMRSSVKPLTAAQEEKEQKK